MRCTDIRLVLFCLLAVAATPVFSQLIPVGETEASVSYVDPSRINKNGDLRSVWVILDLKKKRFAGTQSIRALNQFDCKQERFTMLASFDYSGPKAAGSIIKTNSSSDRWSHIAPDSVADAIRTLVCSG